MNLWIVMCAKRDTDLPETIYRETESWFMDSLEDAQEFAYRIVRDGRQYVSIHTACPIADYAPPTSEQE